MEGLECFGYQQTFSKFFPKLVQSYALDALDWLGESGKTHVSSESIRHLLGGAQEAPGKSHLSLGLGENLRFEDNFVSGASLVHDGRVLRLSGFNHHGHKNNGAKVPFQRFSQKNMELARRVRKFSPFSSSEVTSKKYVSDPCGAFVRVSNGISDG